MLLTASLSRSWILILWSQGRKNYEDLVSKLLKVTGFQCDDVSVGQVDMTVELHSYTLGGSCTVGQLDSYTISRLHNWTVTQLYSYLIKQLHSWTVTYGRL